MQLFICEKFSQAAAYVAALGLAFEKKKGYMASNRVYITWCSGHLLTPLDPKDYDTRHEKWNLESLPIFPREKWNYKPAKAPYQKAQLKTIKILLKKATEVVIASDPDREGELIVVSLLKRYKYTGKTSRVWATSLDKKSLSKKIKEMRDAKYTINEYYAAYARQQADWIHGMNLTMGMSVTNKGMVQGFLSVGRIQTAVLNLVVIRDLEIKEFKPTQHFDMSADFDFNGSLFKSDWVIPKSLLDEDGRCMDSKKIKEVMNKIINKPSTVTENEKTRKVDYAPLLYSLSDLQIECDSKYGISVGDTLAIVQSLYEQHKAVSYPRTNCNYINKEQFSEVESVFHAMKTSARNDSAFLDLIADADLSKETKVWNTKEVNECAHHAIIPTVSSFDITKLDELELKVYDLIRKRYIAQFYTESLSNATKITVECEGEIFKASGLILIERGWKKIIIKKSDDKLLPIINKGDVGFCANNTLRKKKTTPPKRYTEGSLIFDMINIAKLVSDKKMKGILKETDGLGTEATRATIIKVLLLRSYIEKTKKQISATKKAIKFIEYAPKNSKSIEMTAFWEGQLEEIRKGNLTVESFLGAQEKVVNEMMDEIKSGKCKFDKAVDFQYHCPNCGSGLSRYLAKKTEKFYWGCTNNDNCKTFFNDEKGRPIVTKKVQQGSTIHTCVVCKKGKLLRFRSKTKSLFWRCVDDKCKAFYYDENKKPVLAEKKVSTDQVVESCSCFSCKDGRIERLRGKFGFYWKCKSCNVNFKDDDFKPVAPYKKATRDYKCSKCKSGHLIVKLGKKGDFWACNKYPKCKECVSDKDGKPKGY